MYSFIHLINIHWALLCLRHCSKPWECRLGEQIEHVSWWLVLTGSFSLQANDPSSLTADYSDLPQPPSSAHPNYHHLFLLLLDYFLTQKKEKFSPLMFFPRLRGLPPTSLPVPMLPTFSLLVLWPVWNSQLCSLLRVLKQCSMASPKMAHRF